MLWSLNYHDLLINRRDLFGIDLLEAYNWTLIVVYILSTNSFSNF
jgi:hypothetical protein